MAGNDILQKSEYLPLYIRWMLIIGSFSSCLVNFLENDQ